MRRTNKCLGCLALMVLAIFSSPPTSAATTGIENTAFGRRSLASNTTGSYNTADGFSALFSNTSGNYNTADGDRALYSNIDGSNNTADGASALYSNTSGGQNTAYGAFALSANTTGNNNVAVGNPALGANTTGHENTAVGTASLYYTTTGTGNTAIGFDALFFNTSGNNNIGLGILAGGNITTGNNNIDIGNQGVADDDRAIRIGTPGTQTSAYIAGVSEATVSGGAAVYVNSSGQFGTLTSSARFKQNIQHMGEASDVLLALRPVTFRYKSEIDPKGLPQFGLVAEEVEKVDPELVARDEQGRPYSVRYEAVNAMLLNEFLKEHAKVSDQAVEIQDLKDRLEKIEHLLGQHGVKPMDGDK